MLSRRRGGPTPKGRVDRAPWVPLGRELLEISEWPSSTGSKICDSNGTRSKLVVNLASAICLVFHLIALLLVIALPLFDCVEVKPPLAADAKPRQFSFSEQPVNGGPMDVQIFGQFGDGSRAFATCLGAGPIVGRLKGT